MLRLDHLPYPKKDTVSSIRKINLSQIILRYTVNSPTDLANETKSIKERGKKIGQLISFTSSLLNYR